MSLIFQFGFLCVGGPVVYRGCHPLYIAHVSRHKPYWRLHSERSVFFCCFFRFVSFFVVFVFSCFFCCLELFCFLSCLFCFVFMKFSSCWLLSCSRCVVVFTLLYVWVFFFPFSAVCGFFWCVLSTAVSNVEKGKISHEAWYFAPESCQRRNIKACFKRWTHETRAECQQGKKRVVTRLLELSKYIHACAAKLIFLVSRSRPCFELRQRRIGRASFGGYLLHYGGP